MSVIPKILAIFDPKIFPTAKLFCFFIIETILIAKALNINPFDQPAVEFIKKETKNILLRT